MINFLAEISKFTEIVIHPTPTISYSKNYNIYELDIREPNLNTYWTDWGGYYDNFVSNDIEIYYSQFLNKVNTVNELLISPFSMYMINRLVYLNVPKHPWLYPDFSSETRKVILILSSALRQDNPLYNIINEEQALIKLEIPDISIKLSDNYNGIILNQSFSINLINNDGYFDDDKTWNLFNTPVNLKKSFIDNPEYSNFKNIRNGLIENTITNFDKFIIEISDMFRAMEEPVCNIVTNQLFLNINIEKNALGKNIPIVYGTKIIKLLKLNETQYLTAEKVNPNLLIVYDNNGEIVSSSNYTFDNLTNIITSSLQLDSASITGYTDNKIGQIIKDLIDRKTNIPYGLTNWNINETNNYINISPRINIELNSGNVKNAINNILKSDMAYFIQQLDGKFTIRKYGQTYKTHNISNKMITKKPEKNYYKANNNYFSSCIINYDFINNETFKSFIFNERENEAEDKYKKRVQKTFDTDLINETYANNFALLLSDRYTTLKQTLKLSLGIDTSEMNLLDTVVINVDINNRLFSNTRIYFIKEINPAQDILVLEEY